ncbi:MAG: response regulator [Actinomycetes bacterium]
MNSLTTEPDAERSAGEDPPSSEVSLGSRVGVLIVNDDEDACELLCRLMQRAGIVALRAHSPQGAIDELTEHRGLVNGVVLDFTRATATSFAVIESIGVDAELQDLRIMVISETDADRMQAFESGADEYLARPFHADELVDAVHRMLDRTPEEREIYHRSDRG